MGAKGGPKTGGRKKGSRNLYVLETQVRERIINQRKMTPLEFLLKGMETPYPKGRGSTPSRKAAIDAHRLECAKAAAPYMHPRLQAIHHSTTTETAEALHFNKSEPALLEAARRIAFVMAMGAKLAQQSAPEPIEGDSTRQHD